jgi:hypothetical protein
VPGEGSYRLVIHVDAPEFSRHDKVNGGRFLEDVDTEFEIKIKTGRKLSSAA